MHAVKVLQEVPASCAYSTFTTPRSNEMVCPQRLEIPPSTPQERLSVAQRCNSGVLVEVFSHLDHITLGNVARVCRGWQPAASSKLYHEISIDPREPADRILADTLKVQRGLRGLVRCITLKYPLFDERDPSCFHWLPLLPPHSLRSVILKQNIFTRPDSGPIIDFPAIRTVSCMFAYRVFFTEGLAKIMNMPYLETLVININNAITAPMVGALRPKLRTLTIGSFEHTPVIEQILQSFETPLERFDLVVDGLGKDDLASLKNGLRHHEPFLKRLSLIGNPFYELPITDDHILSFPSLETLQCSDLSYTPLIISRLPRTLTSLVLRAPAGQSFASDDYAAEIEQNRHKLGGLSELIILDRDSNVVRLQKYVEKRAFRSGRWIEIVSIPLSPADFSNSNLYTTSGLDPIGPHCPNGFYCNMT